MGDSNNKCTNAPKLIFNRLCTFSALALSVLMLFLFFKENCTQLLVNIVTRKTGWILIALVIAFFLIFKYTPIKKWIYKILPSEPLSNGERFYIVACGIIYLVWAITFVNFGYGPDEGMRYDIPKFIFENNALPFGDEEILRNPVWGFSYGYLITLPVVLSAAFMKIMMLFSSNSIMLLIAARLVSVFSCMGTAYFAIRITKKIFRTPTRWIFITLITLTPQIVFISSYVNNDAFGLMTAVMIIYSWICGLESRWNLKSCIFLAIANGLCLLSYRFYWSFVLCSLFVYLISFIKYRKTDFSINRFFKYGFIIIGVALCICGWVYIRAFILYGTDIFGTKHANEQALLYAQEGYRPYEIAARSIKNTGVTLRQMLIEKDWLSDTFKSMFYKLGYMNISADEWIYTFYNGVCEIGIVGIFVRVLRGKNEQQEQIARSNSIAGSRFYEYFWLMFFMALAGTITFGLSVYSSYTADFQPQGRYVLAVTPILFMLVAGAIESIINLFACAKEKNKKIAKTIVSVVFFIVVVITMLNGFMNCLKTFGLTTI